MSNTVFDDFAPCISGHFFRRCNPGWRMPPSAVNDDNLVYIVKGSARYTINGVPHELESGDLICMSDGDMIEAVTGSTTPMQHYDISFSRKYYNDKKIGGGGGGGVLFPQINRIGLKHDIIGSFRELTVSWNEQSDGYIMKTNALLMLILHRLAEIILFNADSAQGDYRINKITRYISRHYAEKLTVRGLAAQIHLNPDYFGRIFRQETGMMVHQYLNKIRVQNAEIMLQSGGYKVHEVAERCGFSDFFHFYKSFKALRGFPPSRCIPRNTG
jgi:AraC-like DNA-binding protein